MARALLWFTLVAVDAFKPSVQPRLSPRTRRVALRAARDVDSNDDGRKQLRRVLIRGAAAASGFAATPLRASHAAQLAVSLDQPLRFTEAPRRPVADDVGMSKYIIPMAVGAAVVAGAIRLTAQDEEEYDQEEWAVEAPTESFLGRVKPAERFAAAGAVLANVGYGVASGVTSAARRLVPAKREVLPSKEWSVAMLAEVEPLGESGYTKYTFELAAPELTFDLDLCETLALMALDEHGKMKQAEIIPSSPLSTSGEFEVIFRDAPLEGDAYADDATVFASMLEDMDLGHKVAAMPGQKRMTYDADALGPVADVQCIASGLGAASAYGLLRELLTDRGAGIEQASLLWVNKAEKDFMLYDDVEKLYKRHSKVLDIACVVEKDLNGPGLLSNDAFNEVMPASYSEGTMYVVAGPPSFQERICALLGDRRIPKSAIVTVLV